MSRSCPHCGSKDCGSPLCVTYQGPFVRSFRSHSGSQSREVGPVYAGSIAGFTEQPVSSDLQLAGFFRRLGAFAVDWITLSILADIVRFAYHTGGRAGGEMMNLDGAMLLSVVLFLLYFTLLTGEGGQTLGKMVLGIKVVRTDGSSISYSRSFLRAFGYSISTFFFTFLGFLWAGWDRKKQAWHDKMVDTVVVRA